MHQGIWAILCVFLKSHPVRDHATPGCSWVHFVSSCLYFVSYDTDTTDWNQTKTSARLRSGVDRLVIWPIRLQTQVMSPSSASTSVASARRSIFRPERAASSWRVTQWIPAPGNWLRTWITKQLFQGFSNLCLGRREIETWSLCKHWETDKISINSLNGKLNRPFAEKSCFSKDYAELKQTWRSNIAKRGILILLSVRLIRSLNPNDYNYNRRITGMIRLKERRWVCVEDLGNEE